MDTIEIQRKHLRIPIYSAVVIVLSIIVGVWRITESVTKATESIDRLNIRLATIESLDMKTEITLIKYRIQKIEESSAMKVSRYIDKDK